MKKNEAMGIFEKIITIVKVICVIFLICLVSILAIQRFSNNDFAIAGIRIFNVATGSMEPVYNVGYVLIVKEVEPDTLRVGDDITYLGKEDTFAGKVITHRIIRVEKTSLGKRFQTQGVANDSPDPLVDQSQVYGKVLGKSTILTLLTGLTQNMGLFYAIMGAGTPSGLLYLPE